MNLDVFVRLNDDARGARRILDHFNQIATAAKRLAGSGGADRNVRGLARAATALDKAATDAGAARLSRLSTAVTGLAREAAGINAAGKSLVGLSRSISRLAAVSEKAEKAAIGVGKLKSALSGMPSDVGFIGSTNAGLRNMLDLQRRALAGMRSLGGGGGRRGMGGRGAAGGGHMPGVALALQPHGSEALHAVYEQATSLQDAIVRMHLNGLSDSEIAAVRAKADQVAKLNASTTPLANINAIMEARLALGGDLNEALSTAGEMSKLRTITGFALGKDRAKSAEDGVYDMLRTGEIRGVINDPARRASLFKGMTAAMIASNGRITPKQWHSTAIYGRSATQGFSDEFQNNRLPFLMQELQNGGKGGPAGTALQALFRAISLSIGKASNIPEWRKLGLLDETKVVKGAHGAEKALPGAIKLDMANPDQAAFKLLDAIKAGGTTDRGGIVQKFAQLVGTGTGQTAIDVLALQRDRLENFTRTLKMVEDSDTLFAQINETASQSVSNFHASLDTLTGNIGSAVIPAFKQLVDGAAGAVDGLNKVAAIGGRNGNDPVNGQGGGATLLGLAPWAAGAAWVGAKGARLPFVGRAMSGLGGALATGTPFGASLEPAITGAFQRLGNMIPGALRTGIMSGLGKGAITGIGYEIGKSLIDSALAAVLPKPNLSPEKQGAYDAKMRALDGPIWKQPGIIWRDLFGEHETTAPTADVAGHRALGGPVTRGLTYLVGERGPELFTPGVAGGITNNAAFRGMGGARAGEDHDALGNTLAQAIRFQTFALINAIRDLKSAKSGVGYNPANGDAGEGDFDSGETGGDSPSPGGRKGFMSHRGNFKGAMPSGMGGRGFRGTPTPGHWWTPERQTHAVDRLMKEAGLSRDGAEGLVSRWANVEASAGPGAINPRSGAIGIGQWLGSRKRGVKVGDYEGQLTHAIGELNGPENRAAQRLRTAKNARDGAVGASMFERAEHYNPRTGTDDWTSKSQAGAAGVHSATTGGKQDRPMAAVAAGNGKVPEWMDPRSRREIAGVNKELAENLIEAGDRTGIHFAVNQGMRTQAEADANARSGRGVKTSQHLYGAAADIAMLDANGNKTYDRSRYEQFAKAFYDVGRERGTTGQRWLGSLGGRWGKDIVHFDQGIGYGQSHARTPFGSPQAETKEDAAAARRDAYESPMNPFTGGRKSAPGPQVPQALNERAKQEREDREMARRNATSAKAGGAPVHIVQHIHPAPGHDEKHIADAVHRKFNDAVHSQLNDGAFA